MFLSDDTVDKEIEEGLGSASTTTSITHAAALAEPDSEVQVQVGTGTSTGKYYQSHILALAVPVNSESIGTTMTASGSLSATTIYALDGMSIFHT